MVFWRKKNNDLPELDKDFSLDEPSAPPRLKPEEPSFLRTSELRASALSSQNSSNLEKDIQLILAKLDAIRISLESLNHRVEHLEKIASGEE